MSLGKFIREKRTAAHLTLGQLARRLGKRWDITRLGAVENDQILWQLKLQPLEPEDFEMLADALDVDFDELIDTTDLCPHCLGSGKKES